MPPISESAPLRLAEVVTTKAGDVHMTRHVITAARAAGMRRLTGQPLPAPPE